MPYAHAKSRALTPGRWARNTNHCSSFSHFSWVTSCACSLSSFVSLGQIEVFMEDDPIQVQGDTADIQILGSGLVQQPLSGNVVDQAVRRLGAAHDVVMMVNRMGWLRARAAPRRLPMWLLHLRRAQRMDVRSMLPPYDRRNQYWPPHPCQARRFLGTCVCSSRILPGECASTEQHQSRHSCWVLLPRPLPG
jgi:hypothetical protein